MLFVSSVPIGIYVQNDRSELPTYCLWLFHFSRGPQKQFQGIIHQQFCVCELVNPLRSLPCELEWDDLAEWLRFAHGPSDGQAEGGRRRVAKRY
jgi:hypothetical protein